MMEGGWGGVEDNNNEEICRWEATRICQNHQQIYPKIGLTTHKRLSLKNVFLSLSVRSPLSFTNHSKTADNDCKAQELKSRPRATGIYVFNFQFSSSRNAFISFLLFLAHFYDSFSFHFYHLKKLFLCTNGSRESTGFSHCEHGWEVSTRLTREKGVKRDHSFFFDQVHFYKWSVK